MVEPLVEKARRVVTIEMTVVLELEVDDEAVSDWKGYTVEGAFADDERWTAEATRDDKWLGLAVEVGLGGRRLSSIDGWADFPDSAVKCIGPWPSYFLEAAFETRYLPGEADRG